jgi:uncharacterized circularly permuted ATP-grasp superfamily protein
VQGIRPPGGIYCHISGCDLVRDGEGRWLVLEDNVRTPSGISYVLENRLALTRLLPELFSDYRVRSVDHYPALLLDALRTTAPAGAGDPTIVLWTPGPLNSAYFEHAFIARQMGVELVEASDLVVRDDVCYMRTTGGLARVDVIYRRVDDDFLDPLHFRPDSVIGCPGLLNAARAGRVTIANAVGNGVADDKLLYTYVPDLIRYYLREEPWLDNVQSYRLDDPEILDWVLGRLDQLVLKPVDGAGGNGIVIGPSTDERRLSALSAEVAAKPRSWIAQRPVALSTSPVLTGEGLAPRHVDLRPFAVNDGSGIWLLPGGLTRVALREGALVVNSSQGGGSKDTWVLACGGGRAAASALPQAVPVSQPPEAAITGRQSGPASGQQQ